MQNHNKHYLLKYIVCVSILFFEYYIYYKCSNDIGTSQHEPSIIFKEGYWYCLVINNDGGGQIEFER